MELSSHIANHGAEKSVANQKTANRISEGETALSLVQEDMTNNIRDSKQSEGVFSAGGATTTMKEDKSNKTIKGGGSFFAAAVVASHSSRHRCVITCCAPDGSPLQGMYVRTHNLQVLYSICRYAYIHKYAVSLSPSRCRKKQKEALFVSSEYIPVCSTALW